MKMLKPFLLWLISFGLLWSGVHTKEPITCGKQVFRAKAEQIDANGLKCWDTVKVPSCGGQCDSREISDWAFPYKKSHHPVCGYAARKALVVRLRHCDPGVESGTDLFHFIGADDCKCKTCLSKHTSCEWLPSNSTLLDILSYNFDVERL